MINVFTGFNVSGKADPSNPASFLPDTVHTKARSGEVLVRSGQSIDECDSLDSAKDLALVKLDRRIPMSQVRPLHPPVASTIGCFSMLAPINADNFTATIVGFGPTDPGPLFSNTDPGSTFFRTFKSSDDWNRVDVTATEWIYHNSWDPVPNDYYGLLKGDSGGALIYPPEAVDPALCGIVSRYYADPSFPTAVAVKNDFASLDSGPNFNFLLSILDANGHFMGECNDGPPDGRDIDSDCDLIPDSCDVCPLVPARTPSDKNSYDLTGLAGGGTDYDTDGIPDLCDNCPMDANTDQADSDLDGVGNACDRCNSGPNNLRDMPCCTFNPQNPANEEECGIGNLCFPIAINQPDNACTEDAVDRAIKINPFCTGRCGRPFDSDDDGVGDSCDNCKKIKNPPQQDDDEDGIGNACDNCPGSPTEQNANNTNPPCVTDISCQMLNADSICQRVFVNNAVFRCTLVTDDDGDGVGNVCDNCPTTVNYPDGPGSQPNCNKHLEIADVAHFQFPFVGDACDPVPCAYIDVTGAPEVETDEWLKISYSPVLLPPDQASFAPIQLAATPTATVGMRRCTACDVTPSDSSPNACHSNSTCPLNSAEYDNPLSPWRQAQMDLLPGTAAGTPPSPPAVYLVNSELSNIDVTDPAAGNHNGSPIYAGFEPPGTDTAYADWHLGFVIATPPTVLWSHVTQVGGAQDPVAAALLFSPRSNHYVAGKYGNAPGLKYHGQLIAMDVGKFPPGPDCPACAVLRDNPNWMIDPGDGSVLIRNADSEIDLTSVVEPGLRAGMLSATGTWISVVEEGHWLRSSDPRLALISSDGATVTSAVGVQNGLFRDILIRGTSVGPTARQKFGAVLSATENAVFIIGGSLLGGSPPGSPAHDVWEYGVSSGRWTKMLFTGAAPENVLAATFHPENRKLYVVDETIQGSTLVARLLQIDIGTGVSAILDTWPRHVEMNKIFVTNAPRGELMILGTSSSAHSYVGVRFYPASAGTLAITGGVSGAETVVLRPTITDHGLTLPVQPASTNSTQVCVVVQRGISGAVADSSVRSEEGNVNYGSSTTLLEGQVSEGQRYALMRFDLGTILAGSRIDSATISMYSFGNNGVVANLAAHVITAPWYENTVTWNSFASAFDTAASTIFSNGGHNYVGSLVFDIKPLVVSWKERTLPNYGVAITAGGAALANSGVRSSEASTLAQRPKLNVCYTPGSAPVRNKVVAADVVIAGASHSLGECL